MARGPCERTAMQGVTDSIASRRPCFCSFPLAGAYPWGAGESGGAASRLESLDSRIFLDGFCI